MFFGGASAYQGWRSGINSVSMIVRCASKKAAGGGNKNPKQAPGNRAGILLWEGQRAHPLDIIVKKQQQSRLWFHPGLNVRLAGRNHLVARKNGTVRFTCEVPDLNWNSSIVKKYYEGRRGGAKFFKKYVHVIPDPQHTRFRAIDAI